MKLVWWSSSAGELPVLPSSVTAPVPEPTAGWHSARWPVDSERIGSALRLEARREPRKVRLFVVPTHIGARSSSVMSGDADDVRGHGQDEIGAPHGSSCRCEKRRPITGMSPRNGVLSLERLESS